jgi:hypothetical protein
LTFEEYLIQKKIDPRLFREGEPGRYAEFEKLFAEVHPNSFTFQKLNLINFIRRKYLLLETKGPVGTNAVEVQVPESKEVKEAPKPGIARPAFKRKL